MKQLIVMVLCLQSFYVNGALPDCGKAAAQEFGVDEKVFTALALEASDFPKPFHGENYGPMAEYEFVIPYMADGIKTTEVKVKTDSCTNYRAAAWLLTKPIRDGQTSDIWVAVNKYYYGAAARSSYPMTDRVKSRLKDL